ncbi:UvrD/REP helicase [Leptotrichia hongkongensis]|uniref:DNA 3'-5' helicase n=1 Tax=Leptotrichia hongkongensis TaxID=554406 RepID=A0A510L914_9FUSO|nr:UvrD-helicase domain-containing protein [Leptotrichia hongkongensis]BBM60266.1 UvrD/REP helicase [Leptotrichia hongkongensis]
MMKINNVNDNKQNKIILKASAGTGKTYRLSLEYIANLIKGVNYKNIVVMTFTKKATAEIKERIYDFLYQIAFEKYDWIGLEESLKELYGFSDSEILKENLQNVYFEMIKNKDEIRIYTIDGFTNRIFKNTIAPYFGIYNYETIDKEEDEFYNDILIKIIENSYYFEKFKFILNEEKDRKNISTYVKIVKSLLDMQEKFLLAGDNYKEANLILRNNKSSRSFVENFENIFENVKKIAEIKGKTTTEILSVKFTDVFKKFEELNQDSFDTFSVQNKKIELILEKSDDIFAKGNIWNGKKTGGKDAKDLLDEMAEEQEILRGKISNYIFNEEVLPTDKKIKELAKIIFDIAEQMKLNTKRFTHTDISTYTYKFIFDKELGFVKTDNNNSSTVTEDFLELIGGQIDTIMIDEFQDTSILQWKILELLLSSAKNIICVGDEKQSIYNWRGGEKELFENLENLIGGNVQNLEKSYRSYKQIIENVNKIFTNYNENWKYTNSLYRDDKDYQRGYFGYYFQERKSRYGDEEEKPEKAYEEMIRNLKEGKIQNFGKSCIICRGNKELSEITTRLNEEKIPFTLESNSSILDYRAVKPLYKLIKFFVYHNFVYLLEFMRSDLIGCLNDHVKYLVENKELIEKYITKNIKLPSKNLKSKNSFEYFVENLENFEKKENFLEYKNIDFMERNGLSFSEILEKIKELYKLSINLNDKYVKENFSKKIIQDFDVTSFYSTNSDIKNIFQFFNILKEFDNLYEFVVHIEDEKDNLKQISSSDENAINLMTIHKSKGLEFDTIIYYRKAKTGGNNFKIFETYFDYDENFTNVTNFLITFSKYAKNLKNIKEYGIIAEKNVQKEKMEEINADYVALTRAKKNLLLYFEAYITKNGYSDDLVNKLIDVYDENTEFEIGEITETERKIVSNSENLKENTKLEENKINNKILKTYFDDDKFVVKKSSITLEKEFKRKKGLAMHYYFEHISNNLENDKLIAKSALLSRYGNMLGKKIVEELIVRMEKFIEKNSDIYNEKYKVYTEFEIYDSEGRKRIIDRINIDEENKKIYIYDYKTGFEPETNEKYQEQINEYRDILSKKVSADYEIDIQLLEV